MLAFSNNPKTGQKNVFVLGVSPEDEIVTLLSFGFAQSTHHFIVMIPDNAYGEMALRVINRALAERQRFLLAAGETSLLPQLEVVRHRPGETQTKALARHCAATPFDAAIILEQEPVQVCAFIKDLRQRKENMLILGPSAWGDASLSALPELEGVYITLPSREDNDAFRRRYRELFAKEPLFPLSFLVFDAISVLTQTADISSLTSKEFMTEEGFLGVSGAFHFEKNGQARRALQVYQLKGGRYVPVARSPRTS
jgi:hypothetical protein